MKLQAEAGPFLWIHTEIAARGPYRELFFRQRRL